MKKRVFIALDLPDDLKQAILAAQKKLSTFDWPIRWEPIEKLHITLRFLGDITEEELSRVQQIVACESEKITSFQLQSDGYVLFPSVKFPRVICLRIEKNPLLYTFQRVLADKINNVQIGESEHHPFNSHITIGRTQPMNANYRVLVKQQSHYQFECNSISIYRSELSESGSRYTIINNYQLAHPRN